jgi:glycosyltransferase involved in cell wall biosynthesis
VPLAVPRRIRVRPRAQEREARVSVVVPVYNYGRYLEACLRSALDQEGVDLDIVVVDDASADDSLSVARRIAGEDPRVHVIAHARNRGHIATVNEGMAAATGDYVVKLDADDMLTEGSLRRSTALLQAFPSVGFAYGVPWYASRGEVPPGNRARNWTIWPGQEWLSKRFRRGTNCIVQPEAIIRLSVLRDAGPYRAELPHTYDFEMWMRIAARSDVGRINGAYQGFYRDHPHSMSRTIHAGLLIDASQRARAIDSVVSECSGFLPDASRMRDIAHRRLAREALSHAVSAYARGAARQEPVEDYVKLALDIWPEATRLRDWKRVGHLSGMGTIGPWQRPSLAAREALRDLKYRMLWRRWRWSGV